MARYFISYSRRDGSDFAKQLYEQLQSASPDIQLWFDQVDLLTEYPFDKQISDAIKECDGILVVLTRGHASGAGLLEELVLADRYMKPILPIRVHQDAEKLDLLEGYPSFDAVGGLDKVIGELRQALAGLQSPSGQLGHLEERLRRARREAGEANDPAAQARLQATVAQLEDQIAELHKVAEPPEATSKRAEDQVSARPTSMPTEPAAVRTLRGETPVAAVTVGELDGRLIAVSGGEDGTVRVWDLASDQPLGQPLTGHTGAVWAVAVSELDGRPIAVSGGDDRSVRVWDLASGQPLIRSLIGHTGAVWAVAVGELDGRPIAVSGGEDGTVRVWDLASGQPFGDPLTGHTGGVPAVAVGELDGRPIAVSGGDDRFVRVWDLASGQPLGQPLTGHRGWVNAVAVGRIDGRLIAVSGSTDRSLRVWDLASGQPLGQPLTGHTDPVRAVAVGVLDGRPIAVSGSNDHTVRVWDLVGGGLLRRSPTGHTDSVRAVAVGELDGRPIVVSGSEDQTLQIWDLVRARDRVEWLSDAPATRDLLHRQPLAEDLAKRLRKIHDKEKARQTRDTKEGPPSSFLVHIDGPWGTGKTSLLNFLREELEQRGWLTVDFDAWRQARVGPPWWALLAALRYGLGRSETRLLTRLRLRVSESFARLRRSGAPFILALVLLLGVASGVFLLLRPRELTVKTTADLARSTTAALTALGTLWAGALVAGRFLLWDSARGARLFEQSNTNPMQDVAEHFGWLVAKAGRPVVFLIDDLDRCPESYVVELLDAIQTLVRDAPRRLKHPGGKTAGAVYFVVAADGAWIRKSYEIAYEQLAPSVAEPGRPLGYLFLDKLFQLRVPVPSVDAHRQDSYLRELLLEEGAEQPTGQDAAEEQAVRARVQQSTTGAEVVEVLRQASPGVRDRVAPTAVQRLASPEVAEATEHSLQRFRSLLQSNPRSMKRFVNGYSALRAVRVLEGNLVHDDPLALWTIIETRWPSLADYLRANPEAIGLVGKRSFQLAGIPADLQGLFGDPEVRRLAEFGHGGPLTPNLIRACGGATESSETPPHLEG